MNLDIIFVTYNSEKWIPKCVESIMASSFDMKKISLLFCDNASTDSTIDLLTQYKDKYGAKLRSFKVLKSSKNLGFGCGNNKAVKLGNADYILVLNIDTEIEVDTLSKIKQEINKQEKNVGMWELRQKPYEHPKYYDPYTGYTSWASGACMVWKRDVFEKIGGFDSALFMYAEDVEISWRARRKGYLIKYLPNVPITHYSYETPNAFKKTQYIYSLINNLYLRYRYGSLKNIIKGNILVGKRIFKNYLTPTVTVEEDKAIRKIIAKEYLKVQCKGTVAFAKNIFSRKNKEFNPKFILGFDYEKAKQDPFYIIDNLKEEGPLVSVIVRTCNRPATLREALCSLRNQYYKNIEIVIVEDGENISEKMIKEEFKDLNIIYQAIGKRSGRSNAGNLGLELANGEYFNFLDDDDLFYPEHVLVLVNELLNSDYKVAYSTAFETPFDILSKEPYIYKIKDVEVIHKGSFNRMKLFTKNITPIQSVMFHKEVYQNCGGFDTTIEALEDWDLWIRFGIKYDWKYINKTTSLYRVPAHKQANAERDAFLISTLDYVVNKYKDVNIQLSVKDIFDLHNQ